ncbi:MAG TPA: hypothetical protein VGV64_04315 [Thermoplasmata archaeon]|nr:hypothetical protein [Thermoplasmata archaeon]HEV2429057.1 hypothetical protein [Thermoplasmata archaeon]
MSRGRGRALALGLLIELVVFVVSLPGFGIETRSFTQYASWAGPIFLGLTLVIFASGLAGIGWSGRRPRAAAYLAIVMGVASIATTVFDDSHLGGPPPPMGPYLLGFVSIAVAIGLFALAGLLLRALSRPPTPPVAWEPTRPEGGAP